MHLTYGLDINWHMCMLDIVYDVVILGIYCFIVNSPTSKRYILLLPLAGFFEVPVCFAMQKEHWGLYTMYTCMWSHGETYTICIPFSKCVNLPESLSTLLYMWCKPVKSKLVLVGSTTPNCGFCYARKVMVQHLTDKNSSRVTASDTFFSILNKLELDQKSIKHAKSIITDRTQKGTACVEIKLATSLRWGNRL